MSLMKGGIEDRDALLEALRVRWQERPPAISAEHVDRLRDHLQRTLPRKDISPFAPEARRRARVRGSIEAFLRDQQRELPPSPEVVEALYAETAGLGPLESLLADSTISEIIVERWDSLLLERDGALLASDVRFRSPAHLQAILQRLVLLAGRSISPASPLVSFAWQDGSRIQATLPPASPDGALLTLRRFRQDRFSLSDLLASGTLTSAQAEFLRASLRARRSMLVSGAVSSGKTTLLEALLGEIPTQPLTSVLLIEDVPEIQAGYPHVRRLLVPVGEGQLSLRDLVQAALRMRPDLLVIGETRGPEAADLVYALSSGLPGGMTSIHAASPRAALRRLVHYVQMDPSNPFARLPELLMRIVGDSLHLVLQMERLQDGRRRLAAVGRVLGATPDGSDFQISEVET